MQIDLFFIVQEVVEMSILLPKCSFCKHNTTYTTTDENGKEHHHVCCEAFPDSIPGYIYTDHKLEQECNNGIYFEPKEEWKDLYK